MSTDDARAALEDVAIEWFTLMRSDVVTAAQKRAFLRWRKQDESHDAAYRAVEAMWSGLDSLDSASLDQAVSRRSALKKLAIGAVAVSGGAVAWRYGAPGLLADYRTATAEQRRFTLADGSTLELAPRSAVSRIAWDERRVLRLHQGEFFATVAREDGRPFIIQALETEIQPNAGGSFDIALDGADLDVASQDGTLHVGTPLQIDLQSLETVSLQDGVATPVRRIEAAAIAAWRRGRLVFRDAPLPRVARALERYLPGRIVVLGRARTQRITMAIDASRPERALEAVSGTLGLSVTSITPYLTVLASAG